MAPIVQGPLPPYGLASFIQNNGRTEPFTTHEPHHTNLASQILHNLQYQHDWTSLQIHTHSLLSQSPLPRPLISGIAPKRFYVHPDEQVKMLKEGVKEERVLAERDWVMPTHLREKWSLRKFAEVFDAVEKTPPEEGGKEKTAIEEDNKTRIEGKRMLLAVVGDDSTVVYYIMHDGIVKPRQN